MALSAHPSPSSGSPSSGSLAHRPLVVPVRPDPYLDVDAYDPEGDLLVLNLGPQHPSTHGVLRVKLYLDGEVCIKAVPYLGYLHRGVEKLCEKLSYVQITPVVDKNDYVSPFTNEWAINLTFEKLMGTEAPPRAQHLRNVALQKRDALGIGHAVPGHYI